LDATDIIDWIRGLSLDKQSIFYQQVRRIHAANLGTDGDCGLPFNHQTRHARRQYKRVLINRFLKACRNAMRDSCCSTNIPPSGVDATPIVAIRGYQHQVRLTALRLATNQRNVDDTALSDTLAVAAPLPPPACHLTGRSGAQSRGSLGA